MSKHNRERRKFRTYLNGQHQAHTGHKPPKLTKYHAVRLQKHGRRKL